MFLQSIRSVDGGLNVVQDGGQFCHCARPTISAREDLYDGLDDTYAPFAQRVDVGICDGVFPHGGVHGGCHEHGLYIVIINVPTPRDARGEVVAHPVGDLCERVGVTGRNYEDTSPIPQLYVQHGIAEFAPHIPLAAVVVRFQPFRQRIFLVKEMGRGFSMDQFYIVPEISELLSEFPRADRRDAAGGDKEHISSGHLKKCKLPWVYYLLQSLDIKRHCCTPGNGLY